MNKSTYFVNRIIDNSHVSDSNIKVIKKVFRYIKSESYWNADKEKRRAFLKAIITRHEKNFDVYVSVMTGNF